MRIGIVGLGTIGGSFAKAIKTYGNHTVLGLDRNGDAVAFAKFTDSIDGVLTEESMKECDVLLIALYPKASADFLKENGKYLSVDAVVVDLCGVKRAIFEQMKETAAEFGFTFIGGHPMAGAVASGFRAAKEKMFRGASMILVPGDCDDLPKLDRICSLFREVGFSKIVTCTPEEHDRRIAFTSQLPHILSNAYVKNPTAAEHRGFSAGSFRDMARVAKVNVPMWTELFLENADFLAEELDIMIQNLVLYRKALEERDEKTLTALLEEGALRKGELETI